VLRLPQESSWQYDITRIVVISRVSNGKAVLATELWVPAEELDEFNRHIVGKIEIVAEFRPALP
jgi:hypothetical protein